MTNERISIIQPYYGEAAKRFHRVLRQNHFYTECEVLQALCRFLDNEREHVVRMLSVELAGRINVSDKIRTEDRGPTPKETTEVEL